MFNFKNFLALSCFIAVLSPGFYSESSELEMIQNEIVILNDESLLIQKIDPQVMCACNHHRRQKCRNRCRGINRLFAPIVTCNACRRDGCLN